MCKFEKVIYFSISDKNTVFINIGRGSIISEKCLVKALERKWLGGAILDVHEEEPLRKESLLWTMENVSELFVFKKFLN